MAKFKWVSLLSEGQKYVYQYLETLAITYIITRDVVSVTKQHLAQVF